MNSPCKKTKNPGVCNIGVFSILGYDNWQGLAPYVSYWLFIIV